MIQPDKPRQQYLTDLQRWVRENPHPESPESRVQLYMGDFTALIGMAASSASSSCPPAKVRFTYCDEVSERNRNKVWKSGLANIGDARLVWVNEGDILQHGELIENGSLPAEAADRVVREAAAPSTPQPCTYPDCKCPVDEPCSTVEVAEGRKRIAKTVRVPSTPQPEAPTPRTAEMGAEMASRSASAEPVCCQKYETCLQPCTPRGRWQAEQEFARSSTTEPEGYPGIAHDFETMRTALQQIAKDRELFPRTAEEIASKALLDIAPRSATAPTDKG